MNKQEAIKVLNTYDVNFYEYTAEEIVDAIDMAIEALKQVTGKLNNPDDSLLKTDSEACKEQKSKLELISRADAIGAIEELPNAYNGWSDAYDKACIIGALEEVPSAEPKTGEWIPCSERLPSESGRYLVTYPLFIRENKWLNIMNFGKPSMPNIKVKGKCWYMSDDEYGDVVYDDILAWMPLPGPYRKDGEE